jgi:hypothetical protein
MDIATSEHKFINIWKAGKKFFPDETPPPQYCNILDTQISELTPEDIKNNKIKIALSSEVSQDKKREIKEHLNSLGAQSVNWMELNINNPEILETQTTLEKSDLFEIYMSNNPKLTKDFDMDLLRRLNAEVVREGDEQYSLSLNLD